MSEAKHNTEELLKDFMELSQTGVNHIKELIDSSDINIPKGSYYDARYEFLFLFLHYFNRIIYSRFGESMGRILQLEMSVSIGNILPEYDKNFNSDSFFEECNKRENKYGYCKEYDSKGKPFTAEDAIIPIFTRKICEIFGSPLNPELMVCTGEIIVGLLKDINNKIISIQTKKQAEKTEQIEKTNKSIITKIENYYLGQPINEAPDIKEYTTKEYLKFKMAGWVKMLKDERIYHGREVNFKGFSWTVLIGTTNEKIYKIYLQIINSDEWQSEIIFKSFLPDMLEEMGRWSEQQTAPQQYIWDAPEGNFIYELIGISGKYCINIYITSSSIKEQIHKLQSKSER